MRAGGSVANGVRALEGHENKEYVVVRAIFRKGRHKKSILSFF
jgi:hypothetical protein